MMTYDNVRDYLGNISKSGSILGLESITNLMRELSDVQDKIPVIHIAGTNGKGSVGAYLFSIFREMGLNVGRYCSPAVFDPLEVWQCNGQNISKEDYVKVMSQVISACDIVVSKGGSHPTIFEVETAAAFVYFYEKKVDVLLLETGMGGLTDATNLITSPIASVITTISRDHMQFLGNTLEEIAKVKGGIIKSGCPVFSATQTKEVQNVLTQIADKKHSAITFVDDNQLELLFEQPGKMNFTYCSTAYETKMSGIYQMKNAALAIETIYGISDKANEVLVKKAIAKAFWPGRFEVIGEEPLFVIDGAHNEDAAIQLCKTVQNCFTNKPITYIIGVLADKEHEKMLEIMLPYAKRVYTITPDSNRAMDGELLAKEAQKYHNDVMCCKSVEEAVTRALKQDEPVLAFGSLSYLSEVKKAYLNVNK